MVGRDASGAVARLKFALAHPASRASMGYDLAPQHQKLTKSVILKQRPRKAEPMLDVPVPQSPHLQQVGYQSPATAAALRAACQRC